MVDITIAPTIKLLAKLVDIQSSRVRHNQIVHYLGVLNVIQKLQMEKAHVEYVEGRLKYSIKCSKRIKIAVRGSSLRIGPWAGGFDLTREWSSGFPGSHFICVQFDEDWKVMEYYVILKKDVWKFPHSPRYRSGKNTLLSPSKGPYIRVLPNEPFSKAIGIIPIK
jgi:hypothetical protein